MDIFQTNTTTVQNCICNFDENENNYSSRYGSNEFFAGDSNLAHEVNDRDVMRLCEFEPPTIKPNLAKIEKCSTELNVVVNNSMEISNCEFGSGFSSKVSNMGRSPGTNFELSRTLIEGETQEVNLAELNRVEGTVTDPVHSDRNSTQYLSQSLVPRAGLNGHDPDDGFVCPDADLEFADAEALVATCLPGDFDAITPIVQVKACSPAVTSTGKGRPIFCILDTGAVRTVVSRTVFNELNLRETDKGWVKVRTVNNLEMTPHKTTELNLSRLHPTGREDRVPLLVNAMVVETIPIPALMASPEISMVKVDMIVGQDNCWSIIKREPHQLLECGLVVLNTIFGKVFCGRSPRPSHPKNLNAILGTTLQEFNEEDFWALERIGIEGDMESNALTKQNEAVRAEFEQTVKIVEGDIFVKFPWKEGCPVIADNFSLAKRRLYNQLKLMENKPEVINAYHAEFVKQIERGVLEVAPRRQTGRIKYYIPHHGVVKPDSATTKLRIVLDASSHMKGELSLNDVLHSGPQLVPGLIGILLRSRLHKFLVISDIEKAFHAVKLQETERDCTRILWLKDIDKPPTPENLIIYRYTRVPFGIKSSPYLLAISILFSMKLFESEEVVEEVERCMYVDNLLTGANSRTEALEKYRRHKAAFSRINMNLREFMVNDQLTMESIDPEDRMEEKKVIKLLGTLWDLEADTISVKVGLNIQGPVSKRTVLRAVAANFDPIGISIPVMIEPKAFLQSLWKSENNYKWDTELVEEDMVRWREIEYLYGPPRLITVPRIAAIKVDATSEARCHIFSDASSKAFAAVAYLQQEVQMPQLYFAKNRLHPIKLKGTIPKFELLSVLCSINTLKFLISEVPFRWSEINIFCDSMIAISWIKAGGDRKQGVFVDNRVQEIRTALLNWKEEGRKINLYHVPGDINPADLGTKGKTVDQLVHSTWYHGPKFLLKPKERWPKSITLHELSLARIGEESMPELLQLSMLGENSVGSVFDWSRFSTFQKLIRTAAMVLKAVRRWRTFKRERVAFPRFRTKVFMPIDKEEYRRAQVLVFRQHQLEQAVTIRKENPDFVFNSEGLMCRHDRFSANLDGEEKNPIIVVKNCTFSRLLIHHFHVQNGHGGASHTASAIKRKVWIRHSRAMVKSITKSCVVCKKLNGLPYKMPNFADVPKFRMGICKPFESTGLDFFGPMKAKEEDVEKPVWALIFTCLVTRNIYLQIVRSMNTSTFLAALRSFSSRRGAPSEILCDNALAFQLATKYTYRVRADEPPEEADELSDDEVAKRALVSTLASHGIKWKFTVPHAPWEGGLYERLIGNVKRTLKKVSHIKVMQYYELEMMLTEVEGFVNSRPLTYVSDDLADQVVRPIDFITPGLKLNLQVLTEDELCGDEGYKPHIPKTQAEVEKAIKRLNKHLDNLWKYFKSDYLQALRERTATRFRGRGSAVEPICGEIVLIIEPNVRRGQYLLGKIEELHPSSDGKIRSATVRLGRNEEPRLLRRPLSALIPLEIASKPVVEDECE